MKTATIIKLVDKLVSLITYFINESKRQERKENHEQIKEDPSDWANERYGGGVQQSDEPDKSESGSDDSKT